MSAVNTESIPPSHTNGVIEDGYDEDDKSKNRPADIDADMREMERRKRVELIMNSRLFREELERIIESQIKAGNSSAGLLQQISDMVGSTYSGVNNHLFRNTSCAVPINDIRGVEAMGYAKGEKILRCKLAALFRLIDLYGWSQGIYNHVTARLSQKEEHFLVNPYGLLYSEITASSLVKVDMQGNVIESGTTNFSVNVQGFQLHAAIYAARPDLKCIVHLHTPSVLAVSSLKDGLLPICQEAAVIGDVSHHPYTGIPNEPEERDKIARNLGPNNKVIFLNNHGALCCGETIEETFFYAYNTVNACETQLKVLPLGKDNLVLLSDETRKSMYDAARKVPESIAPPVSHLPAAAATTAEKRWRIGGLEFEAIMRMLDNAGFRTGYIYRQPLIKGELPRPRNDVEVPPAVSSLGYLLEEEELYKGQWRKHYGGKGSDRIRWLNSPNVYQKVEILETGTSDPKKITKWVDANNEEWVADGSPSHTSTPVKIENALQFVPKNTNPKEFKKLQQQIKDNRRADKITSGPQSHILEGVSWEEAKKLQDANISGTSDQVILVGAASKGIIQREYQHNATVYKTPYAKNPFDAITDEELENYKKDITRKQRGDSYYDEDESDALSSSLPPSGKRNTAGITSETEDESLTHEMRVIQIETTTVPKASQAEVVLSDDKANCKLSSQAATRAFIRDYFDKTDRIEKFIVRIWEIKKSRPIFLRLRSERAYEPSNVIRLRETDVKNVCKQIADELTRRFANGDVFGRVRPNFLSLESPSRLPDVSSISRSFDSSETEITTLIELPKRERSVKSPESFDFASDTTEDEAEWSPQDELKRPFSLSSLSSCIGQEYENPENELTTSIITVSDDTSRDDVTVICKEENDDEEAQKIESSDSSLSSSIIDDDDVFSDSNTYSCLSDVEYDFYTTDNRAEETVTSFGDRTNRFRPELTVIYEENTETTKCTLKSILDDLPPVERSDTPDTYVIDDRSGGNTPNDEIQANINKVAVFSDAVLQRVCSFKEKHDDETDTSVAQPSDIDSNDSKFDSECIESNLPAVERSDTPNTFVIDDRSNPNTPNEEIQATIEKLSIFVGAILQRVRTFKEQLDADTYSSVLPAVCFAAPDIDSDAHTISDTSLVSCLADSAEDLAALKIENEESDRVPDSGIQVETTTYYSDGECTDVRAWSEIVSADVMEKSPQTESSGSEELQAVVRITPSDQVSDYDVEDMYIERLFDDVQCTGDVENTVNMVNIRDSSGICELENSSNYDKELVEGTFHPDQDGVGISAMNCDDENDNEVEKIPEIVDKRKRSNDDGETEKTEKIHELITEENAKFNDNDETELDVKEKIEEITPHEIVENQFKVSIENDQVFTLDEETHDLVLEGDTESKLTKEVTSDTESSNQRTIEEVENIEPESKDDSIIGAANDTKYSITDTPFNFENDRQLDDSYVRGAPSSNQEVQVEEEDRFYDTGQKDESGSEAKDETHSHHDVSPEIERQSDGNESEAEINEPQFSDSKHANESEPEQEDDGVRSSKNDSKNSDCDESLVFQNEPQFSDSKHDNQLELGMNDDEVLRSKNDYEESHQLENESEPEQNDDEVFSSKNDSKNSDYDESFHFKNQPQFFDSKHENESELEMNDDEVLKSKNNYEESYQLENESEPKQKDGEVFTSKSDSKNSDRDESFSFENQPQFSDSKHRNESELEMSDDDVSIPENDLDELHQLENQPQFSDSKRENESELEVNDDESDHDDSLQFVNKPQFPDSKYQNKSEPELNDDQVTCLENDRDQSFHIQNQPQFSNSKHKTESEFEVNDDEVFSCKKDSEYFDYNESLKFDSKHEKESELEVNDEVPQSIIDRDESHHLEHRSQFSDSEHDSEHSDRNQSSHLENKPQFSDLKHESEFSPQFGEDQVPILENDSECSDDDESVHFENELLFSDSKHENESELEVNDDDISSSKHDSEHSDHDESSHLENKPQFSDSKHENEFDPQFSEDQVCTLRNKSECFDQDESLHFQNEPQFSENASELEVNDNDVLGSKNDSDHFGLDESLHFENEPQFSDSKHKIESELELNQDDALASKNETENSAHDESGHFHNKLGFSDSKSQNESESNYHNVIDSSSHIAESITEEIYDDAERPPSREIDLDNTFPAETEDLSNPCGIESSADIENNASICFAVGAKYDSVCDAEVISSDNVICASTPLSGSKEDEDIFEDAEIVISTPPPASTSRSCLQTDTPRSDRMLGNRPPTPETPCLPPPPSPSSLSDHVVDILHSNDRSDLSMLKTVENADHIDSIPSVEPDMAMNCSCHDNEQISFVHCEICKFLKESDPTMDYRTEEIDLFDISDSIFFKIIAACNELPYGYDASFDEYKDVKEIFGESILDDLDRYEIPPPSETEMSKFAGEMEEYFSVDDDQYVCYDCNMREAACNDRTNSFVEVVEHLERSIVVEEHAGDDFVPDFAAMMEWNGVMCLTIDQGVDEAVEMGRIGDLEECDRDDVPDVPEILQVDPTLGHHVEMERTNEQDMVEYTECQNIENRVDRNIDSSPNIAQDVDNAATIDNTSPHISTAVDSKLNPLPFDTAVACDDSTKHSTFEDACGKDDESKDTATTASSGVDTVLNDIMTFLDKKKFFLVQTSPNETHPRDSGCCADKSTENEPTQRASSSNKSATTSESPREADRKTQPGKNDARSRRSARKTKNFKKNAPGEVKIERDRDLKEVSVKFSLSIEWDNKRASSSSTSYEDSLNSSKSISDEAKSRDTNNNQCSFVELLKDFKANYPKFILFDDFSPKVKTKRKNRKRRPYPATQSKNRLSSSGKSTTSSPESQSGQYRRFQSVSCNISVHDSSKLRNNNINSTKTCKTSPLKKDKGNVVSDNNVQTSTPVLKTEIVDKDSLLENLTTMTLSPIISSLEEFEFLESLLQSET